MTVAVRAASLLGVLLILASCAKVPRPLVLPPAASAEERWATLLDASRSAGTLESHARVRLARDASRTSFRARIAVDQRARTRIDVLTPLGTTAASLYFNGDEAVVANVNDGTYWEGSLSELMARLPEAGSLLALTRHSRLIFGLPVESSSWTACVREAGCYDDGRVRLHVGQNGLTMAELRGSAAIIRYDTPEFPPQRLTVESASGNVTIEHLEVVAGNDELKRPDTKQLRCCFLPRLD